MTLREQIASDLENVFLNEDDFASAVTFYPRGGGSRSVVMSIDRRRDFRENDQGLTNIEVAECLCLRDPDHATKGGIDNPQIGDGILLSEADDREQRQFAYMGIVTDISPASWVLHFQRDIQFRHGGNN